jgi:hypothetical protein
MVEHNKTYTLWLFIYHITLTIIIIRSIDDNVDIVYILSFFEIFKFLLTKRMWPARSFFEASKKCLHPWNEIFGFPSLGAGQSARFPSWAQTMVKSGRLYIHIGGWPSMYEYIGTHRVPIMGWMTMNHIFLCKWVIFPLSTQHASIIIYYIYVIYIYIHYICICTLYIHTYITHSILLVNYVISISIYPVVGWWYPMI